ncbi:MAG: hypothetical protein A2Y72_03290 [Chloroflexi bacterium RBG_13_53_26]|nr:MAG: hypothetical protein A2Y72_03290 [Chloroflexi bacterium RBG_13_53_26]
MAKVTKKHVAIGAGVVAILGLIYFLVVKTPAKETPTIEPVKEPEKKVEEPPPLYADDPNPMPLVPKDPPAPAPLVAVKPPEGANPLAPETTPTQGAYYAVTKGDTMLGILAKAGFQQADRHKAYLTMLNHAKNAWIGQTTLNNEKILRFYQRFAALTGYEVKSWAYMTKWQSQSSSAYKWPVVYVPAAGEVSA